MKNSSNYFKLNDELAIREEFLCMLCQIPAVLAGIILLLVFPSFSYCNSSSISLESISSIESSNNPRAIGDHGKALGLFQLHNCVISDYNTEHHSNYAHSDALEPHHAKKIADWYLHEEIPRLLRYYDLNANLDNVLTAWNMGIGKVKQGKKARNYIKKYKQLIKKTKREVKHENDIGHF
jgi:hypothetical protein